MKKRGISLIVLIITIIVVIILASIIILSINKNNPIKKAQEAKFKSEVSQFKEELLMTHANNLAENKRYKSESINISVGNYNLMKTYIPSITEDYADRLYIKNGELAYVEPSNIEYDEEEAIWAKEVNIKTIPKVPSEWTEYIDSLTEDGVPIPKGFTYKEGTKETGVVIEDGSHNEFVWIPSTEIEYVKDLTFPGTQPTGEDTILSGLDETLDVKKYGGFYIGRYEATTPDGVSSPSNTTGVPTCQKGKTVWTNISYTNSKASAESMYTGNTSSVQSGLLTGKAWDRTCHWIEDYITTINTNSTLKDSRYYGNYSDSEFPANTGTYTSNQKQLSGANENWKTKNIYDLAGNVGEWTYEITSAARFFAGGGSSQNGNVAPVSYRNNNGPSYAINNLGFRIRLYIKTN